MSKHEMLSTRCLAKFRLASCSFSEAASRQSTFRTDRRYTGPKVEALMETTANGFQVGGYGPKGNEQFWLTKNSSAVCSDKMEAAQPL